MGEIKSSSAACKAGTLTLYYIYDPLLLRFKQYFVYKYFNVSGNIIKMISWKYNLYIQLDFSF